MSKYIDAEALNLYDNLFMSEDTINKSGVYVRYRAVENLIKNAPTADVQEVKHGKWIEPVPGDGFPYCSNCKNIALDRGLFLNPKLMDWHLTPYCPHCGAKMDEERELEQ